MERLPATSPPQRPARTGGTGRCVVIGLACGIGVPLLTWVLRVGNISLLALPLVALVAGGALGRSVRVTPRTAGVAFFGGAMVWAVIGAGGGLLWPVRVLVGSAVTLAAAAAFATAIAWRQRRRTTKALPKG